MHSVEVPDYPDLDLLDARLDNILMALDLPPSLQDLDGLIAGSSKHSRLFRAATKDGVRATPEFERVFNLPRREWTQEAKEALAEEMTELLKTPTGTMKLKPDQAVALLELGIHRGLLGPLRAGAGKTLILFLAPYVLNLKRPVLLMPAKLIAVKQKQLAELAQHWKVAYWLTMMSYESLSRVAQKTFLDDLKCDGLLCDESQKLKNPRAAVTKVVKRYVEKTHIPFISLSGTITKRSVQDYAPHAKWALGPNAPVPLVWSEVEEWGNAIDEKPRSNFRTHPGALTRFSDGAEDLSAVRIGFQKRLIETPGVVATFDKLTDCSLMINRVSTEAPEVIRRAYALLRKKKERLDGWAFASGIDQAAYARQLALGFYYRYNPWPPVWWLSSRKAYASFSRYVLSNNRQNIDSELQVRNAYDRGELKYYQKLLEDECGPDPLNHWRETEPKFSPKKEAVWLSDYALTYCATWLEKPGIVWCEHVEFAEQLALLTGASYCGAGGVDSVNGTPIEHLAGQPVIASIRSSGEGRDLQHGWNRSLVTASIDGGAWEQLLARMHRDGQLEDEVYYEALILCAEHESGFAQALEDSRYIEETTKQPQRLRYADLVWPDNNPSMFDPIFNKEAHIEDKDLPHEYLKRLGKVA